MRHWRWILAMVGLVLCTGPARLCAQEIVEAGGVEFGERPRVGLVLAGGGAKGFAHIGVLKVLDSLQVPIDCIAGTSMGGIVGALRAVGWSGAEIEAHVRATDWEAIFTDQPARRMLPYLQKQQHGRYQLEFGLSGLKPVPPSGWIYGQKLELLFTDLVHPFDAAIDFDELPVPVRCVALDLVTGNTVVLGEGSLAKAMRATMAIPTVFSPVVWGDSLLVDGGGTNNLPVDVARGMGADLVIAVDFVETVRREDLRSAVDVLERWFVLTGAERYRENLAQADLILRPDLAGHSLADFEAGHIAAIIARGERAGRAAAGQIDSLLAARGVGRTGAPPVGAILREPSTAPRIERLEIGGNPTLPGALLFRWLDLEPGQPLDRPRLTRGIMELYGLGYFETITYSTRETGPDRVVLTLDVRERQACRLRVGLRYDDHHKLVAAVSEQANNLPWPGLRLEHELQFAGLTRYRARASYPSRTLALPVYPFLELRYENVPTDLYNSAGERIASFDDASALVEGGIGFQLFKSFNTEVTYGREAQRVESHLASSDARLFAGGNATLNLLRASLDIDTLDDTHVPSAGFRLRAGWEGSYPRLHSDLDYEIWQISSDLYRTIGRWHTFRLHGLWSRGAGEVPLYKQTSAEVPWSFVGQAYDQLRGDRLGLGRVEYRYRWKRDIFVKLIANMVVDQRCEPLGTIGGGPALWGWGGGLQMLSPAGPVEILVASGSAGSARPHSYRDRIYVTIGCRF